MTTTECPTCECAPCECATCSYCTDRLHRDGTIECEYECGKRFCESCRVERKNHERRHEREADEDLAAMDRDYNAERTAQVRWGARGW